MAKITVDLDSVSVSSPGGVEQVLTITARYTGEENLSQVIQEGEQLVIEIPSHAPPPEPKKGK